MRTAVVGIALALALVSPTSAQDETIFKTGNKGVSSPRLIKDVKPQYTAGAMRRGVNGTVFLRCVVDLDGVPTRLEIVKALDEELDRASLEAMKQWRFEPGQKDGKAVLVQIDVMMAFTTSNTKTPNTKKSLWRRIWRRA
jgi:TonB family protein